MGVKPLYYFWDGKTLLFASEIKAILASGLVSRQVNRQAVWDYLMYRYVPGTETIWEGIRRLPPGHILRFREGQAEEVCYWQTDVVNGPVDNSTEQTIEMDFTSLFLDAVQLRLVASDVPVGVFLSGGLDSSAIAAAAVELGHKNFHTFSVGFKEGGDFSELPYARTVASHVGAQHHEVVLDQKQFIEMLPEVVLGADEPLADLTLVPLLSLARLARQNVKVVLTGEGSDEILAGYSFDENERQWDRVRILQRLPRSILRIGATLARFGSQRIQRRAEHIRSVPLSDWNRKTPFHNLPYWDQNEKERLWPGRTYQDSLRFISVQYAAARSDDPLQQVLSVFQKDWLVEDLLMKADKMSMAASLEARTPFLDYRLVEWANRQPNSVKVHRSGLTRYRTKHILRRFCEKRLPGEIVNRPKKGFPVPAYGWLQNGLDRWATDTLLGNDSRIARALDRDRVESVVQEARIENGLASHRVWILIMLELWLQSWNVELT
jgi:asparagine synthase (glutamine-hydrolysing)